MSWSTTTVPSGAPAISATQGVGYTVSITGAYSNLVYDTLTTAHCTVVANNGVTYSYAVVAINSVGSSTPSASASVVNIFPATPIVSDPTFTSGTMNMSWNVNSLFNSINLFDPPAGNYIVSQSSTAIEIHTQNNYGVTINPAGNFTNGILHWVAYAPAINCGNQESYTLTIYVDGNLISQTTQSGTASGNTASYSGYHAYDIYYVFNNTGNASSTGSLAISLSPNDNTGTTYSVAIWDSTTSSLKTTLSSATSPATYASITPQHSYYYIVTATNAVDAASTTSGTVQYLPPTAPSANTPTFTGNTINMTWVPSSNGTITYIVEIYDTSSVTRIGTINNATSPATYSSLTYTHSYYFIVTATNAQGSASSTSSTVLCSQPNNPPSSFTANTPTFTTIPGAVMSMTWTASTYATSYSVAVWDSTTSSLKTTINSATSPATFTNLINSHSYYFIVTATNTYGSTTSTSSTEQYIAPNPPSLTILTANFTQGYADFSWTNSGGAAVYDVYWSASWTDQEGYTRSASNTETIYGTSIYEFFGGGTDNFTSSYSVTATNAGGTSTISG